MANNEKRVFYKVIADYKSLEKAIDRQIKKLAQLKAAEDAFNASSATGAAKSEKARKRSSDAVDKQAKAFEAEASALSRGADAAARAVKSNNKLTRSTEDAAAASEALTDSIKKTADAHAQARAAAGRAADAIKKSAEAQERFRNQAKASADETASSSKKIWIEQDHVYMSTKKMVNGMEQLTAASRKVWLEQDRVYTTTTRVRNGVESVTTTWRKATKSQMDAAKTMTRTQSAMQQTQLRATQLKRGLDKVGNWRPRLTPPFIALIPIIGSVLGLINPLIAGLGAVSAAALGFGSSLASIAGSAIAAVPALSTLIGVVATLKTAFSGVGGVFKAFGAMQKAGGGGGGGAAAADKPLEISQTEKIARANEQYRRSIQDVRFAQEDLNDARKEYTERLKDLQKQVDRTAQSEARAAANSQLARENYANVLADPGSTKGQKMDAQAGIDEAASEYKDVVQENKEAANELASMKKKGMNGDRAVIQAQRAVTDAIDAQRDAQIGLQNAIKGTADAAGAGGAGGAADQFNDALNKLSPSARKVVLALIAMNGEFVKMKRTVQEAFFSRFVGNIERLRLLFPPVTSMMVDLATALGDLANKLLLQVTSPEWLKDIALFGKLAAPVVTAIGDGLLYLLDGFKDLTIAAMPFLLDLANGFKEGSKNLRELIGTARGDGSLANWLDTVRGRMAQWWRIIKNIGKTLFNYGAATSGFGQWLTDGFERVTQGWLDSSEAARTAGSPFQEYLEDIEPLLSEINGLLGDFFGWLGRTMSDPENIKMMTELVKTIRDDLGPAVTDILDTLADTGIGVGFVQTLTSIIETLDTVLKNGGADAILAFLDVVQKFFDIVKDIASIPGAGGVITTVAAALAGLAALSFIGKFTGLTSLFGWLIKLTKTRGMASLLEKLGGLKNLKASEGAASKVSGAAAKGANSLSRVGAAVSTGAGAAAQAAARAARSVRGTPGYSPAKAGPGVQSVFDGVFGGKAGNKAANISSLGNKAASLGKIGKGLGAIGAGASKLVRGAGPGAILSIAGGLTGDAIKNNAAKGSAGGGARAGGGILSAASTGAGVGATVGGIVGSVVPGVGTAVGAGVGAGVGAVAGGVTGFVQANPADRQKFIDDTMGMFSDFFTVNVPNFLASIGPAIWDGLTTFGQWLEDTWEGAKEFIAGTPERIGYAIGFVWGKLQVFGDWVAETWESTKQWFIDLPARVAETAGDIWDKLEGAGVWLGKKLIELGDWFKNLPTKVAYWAKGIWDALPGAMAWLGRKLTELGNWFRALPGKVASWAKGIWDALPGVRAWLAAKLSDLGGWFRNLPSKVGYWAEGIWNSLPGVGQWLADIGTSIYEWAIALPGKIGGWVGNVFRKVTGSFSAGFTKGESDAKYNGGKILKRAGGGSVPGIRANSDTVPAMLTPGEVVIRKAMVNRIGEDNLLRLNSGVLSFADMLGRAAKSKQDSNDTGMGGDFSGYGQGPAFFSGGGLVPDMGSGSGSYGGSSTPTQSQVPTSSGAEHRDGFVVEQLIINNPKPETASDSLPRTIRKVGYLGAARNGS